MRTRRFSGLFKQSRRLSISLTSASVGNSLRSRAAAIFDQLRAIKWVERVAANVWKYRFASCSSKIVLKTSVFLLWRQFLPWPWAIKASSLHLRAINDQNITHRELSKPGVAPQPLVRLLILLIILIIRGVEVCVKLGQDVGLKDREIAAIHQLP